MKRRYGLVSSFVPIVLFSAISAAFGAARVNFTRTVPPTYDLGPAEQIAVVYAIGDNDKVMTFVDVFVDQTNHSGTLRAENAVEGNQVRQLDEAALKRLRRMYSAGAYLGVSLFTCNVESKEGEGSTRGIDGERVKRRHYWYDATCQARVDVLSAVDGKKRLSYQVRGEGTSPRVPALTDEEKSIAMEQAARYAAVAASEGVTPRLIRESIELDETAPSFEEGYALIEAGRLEAARKTWTDALRGHRNSAGLHFNLAAVCEALGDVDGATKHFVEARRIAPDESHIRSEFRQFIRRNNKKTTP